MSDDHKLADDQTRITVDQFVFGGPTFNSPILVNCRLVSLQSFGISNRFSVLFVTFLSIHIHIAPICKAELNTMKKKM